MSRRASNDEVARAWLAKCFARAKAEGSLMIVTHGEDEYTGRPPADLVPFGVDWQSKSFIRARYDHQYRRTAMDDDCYGRFIPEELRAATRQLSSSRQFCMTKLPLWAANTAFTVP